MQYPSYIFSIFQCQFIVIFKLSIRTVTYRLSGIWFLINWLSCPKARHFIGHPICTQHTPLIFIWSSNPLETHSHAVLLVFTVNWPTATSSVANLCVCVWVYYEKHKYFSLTFRIELTNCQHACCLATGVANIFQLNVCGEIKLQNLTIYWQTHKFDLVLGLHLLAVWNTIAAARTPTHTYTYTYT